MFSGIFFAKELREGVKKNCKRLKKSFDDEYLGVLAGCVDECWQLLHACVPHTRLFIHPHLPHWGPWSLFTFSLFYPQSMNKSYLRSLWVQVTWLSTTTIISLRAASQIYRTAKAATESDDTAPLFLSPPTAPPLLSHLGSGRPALPLAGHSTAPASAASKPGSGARWCEVTWRPAAGLRGPAPALHWQLRPIDSLPHHTRPLCLSPTIQPRCTAPSRTYGLGTFVSTKSLDPLQNARDSMISSCLF